METKCSARYKKNLKMHMPISVHPRMTVFILLKAVFFLVGVRGDVFDADRGDELFFPQPTGGVAGQVMGGGVPSAACCLLADR